MSEPTREKLLKSLLDDAKKLAGAGTNVTNDIQGLQVVLLGAAKAKFLNDYQVDFNGSETSPKDLAIGKGPDVRAVSALYYLPDSNPPNLKTFIEENLFKAIDFTRSDVKFAANEAYSGLEKELTQTLQTFTGNNWLSAAISQTYRNPEGLNYYPLRTTSVIFYTNAQLREGSVTVKMKFISYLGVYYHTPSPQQEMFAKIFDNLGHLYDPASIFSIGFPKQFPPPFSSPRLQRALEEYAKLKFEDEFEVEFAGNITKPKDQHPPGETPSILYTVVILDNEWDNIEDLIFFEIFTHGSIPFVSKTSAHIILSGLNTPGWLTNTVFPEIVEACVSVKEYPVDGSIYSTMSIKTYKDPTHPQGSDWKSLRYVTFSNAAVSEGGMTISRTFINFIGVFYRINSIGVVKPRTLD